MAINARYACHVVATCQVSIALDRALGPLPVIPHIAKRSATLEANLFQDTLPGLSRG